MSKSSYVAGVSLLMLAGLVLGCSTTDRSRAEQTASSMQEMKAEFQSANASLEGAVAALNAMVEKPDTDLTKQYQAYSDSIAALDKQLELIRRRAETMRAKGLEYFDSWKAESGGIANPDLKKHSEEREAELREEFESIRDDVEALRGNIQPLAASLRDVQTMLSLDLTPQGVEAARGPAKKATKNLNTVQEEIIDVIEGIDEVHKLLSPARSAPK